MKMDRPPSGMSPNHFHLEKCPLCDTHLLDETQETFPHGGRRGGELIAIKEFACGTEVRIFKVGSDTRMDKRSIGVECFENAHASLIKKVAKLEKHLDDLKGLKNAEIEKKVKHRLGTVRAQLDNKCQELTFQNGRLSGQVEEAQTVIDHLIERLDDAQEIPTHSEKADWEWEQMNRDERIDQWHKDAKKEALDQ